MKKTEIMKKVLGILLCICMLISYAPVSAYASDDTVPAATGVASVTDADGNDLGSYDTLDNAVSAAADYSGTVTLLDNVELTSTVFIPYYYKRK